jgi:hypothetical protein
MVNTRSSPAYLSLARLFSKRRVLIGFALIGSILFQFGVAWRLRKQIATGITDFSGLYTGGKIVASGNGGNLYDLATQERVEGAFTVRGHSTGFLSFTPHAPPEALFFAPLTAFPYSTAAWIWWVCNLLLGYFVLFLLRLHLPRLDTRLDLAMLALGCFLPLLAAECQGQNSVLTLLLFTVCFINLARGRPWMAGSALALTTYKPQLALVMIVILAITSERRWRILAGFLQTCIGLVALSVALVGWRAYTAYLGSMCSFAAGFDDAKSRTNLMPNLRGLMYYVSGSRLSHPAFVLLVGVVSLLFVLAVLWTSRGKRGTPREMHLQFALAVTVTQIVSYHGFLHDMTVLLLPLYLVWDSLAETGLHTWKRRLLAAIMLLLFFFQLFLPVSGFPFTACAVIAFFVLLCWELRAAEGPASVIV